MKKLILFSLSVMLILASLLIINNVCFNHINFTVKKNAVTELDDDVKISFFKSDNNYTGTLYLPGNVNPDELTLSWGNNAKISVDGTTYANGEAPLPPKGESLTYHATLRSSSANYTIKTMQGSRQIKAMFLSINENLGTISAMNEDPNAETKCFGEITFDGKRYPVSIKGRGNSTWKDFTKKPYNITFYQSFDYQKKKIVSLIKGINAKQWCILANAKDPTCLRNKIGYDIANELGIGLKSENIDVWINGEYCGNYLLTPKSDFMAPKNGFMIEIDNLKDSDQFTLQSSPLFTVKQRADSLTVDGVKNSFSEAWDALQRSESDDYLKYFDLDSWAKLYLLHEFYKNCDITAGSLFFSKNSMNDCDKLTAGPVWDLDTTLGRVSKGYINVDPLTENSGSGWYIDSIAMTPTPFLQLLGKHESFMQRVYEIYNEYKREFESVLYNLDSLSTYIADSAAMNYTRWPQYTTGMKHYSVLQDYTKYGCDAYAVVYLKTDSWEAYVNNLSEYITKRLSFFSDNLTVTAPVNGEIVGLTNIHSGDSLTLTANTIADSYQWQASTDGIVWTNIVGANSNVYSVTASEGINELFIRCAARNIGKQINTIHVVSASSSAVTLLEPVKVTVY